MLHQPLKQSRCGGLTAEFVGGGLEFGKLLELIEPDNFEQTLTRYEKLPVIAMSNTSA